MSQYFNLRQYSFQRRGLEQEPENQQPAKPEAVVLSKVAHDSSEPSLGQTSDTKLPEVDGRRAWLVVLGSFCAHISVLGVLYSFGIFVAPLAQELRSSRAEISLIGTINIAFFYLTGIFAGPLGDKYGVQPVMSVGCVMWVSGCLLASFSQAFWHSLLSQGILLGVGTSFVYWPAISCVPQWFDKYRATAVGFATVGAGLGNLIFAVGGSSIIESLGWRNTLRVFAGVGGGVICIAVALVKRRLPNVQGGGLFTTARILIRMRSYQLFLVATFLFQWGFFIPFVHLAVYTTDLGIAPTLGGLAIAMLGIGSSVGRLLTGPVGDLIGRMFTFRVCMFLAGAMLAIWPACRDISGILVFAFFYAFFAGGFIAQSPVIAADLWGLGSLGGTFALVNLVMIPGGMACGPLAGLVFETYGTYWPAIWGGAIFLISSAVVLLFVHKEPLPQALGGPPPGAATAPLGQTQTQPTTDPAGDLEQGSAPAVLSVHSTEEPQSPRMAVAKD